MQIACPKCNSILEFPSPYIHDGGCPRCGAQIRIRKGKAYEQSQIVDNLLYSITVLFAQIAKEDFENINIYQNLFNNFVGRQALTKNQLNDINNTFKSEQKGGLFHDNYKKVIKSLKEDLDYAYRQSEISTQENTENTVFSLLLQMAYGTGNIKPEQQLILDEYIKCFGMSEKRVSTFTTKYQPKQKKEINIEESFSKVVQNAQTLFFHQEKFINELSISLKRPYIYPQQNPFKSLSFILTQEEDLVLDIFNKMLSDMKYEELIQELPLILECTEFSDDSNFNNFGNKLFEFFNSQNEVILLKNFKALSPSALNFFSSIITGKNSQVKCNNKFIFLLTSGSQDEIYNLMAEEFYNKITDIVKLEDLTDEEIESLITNCTNNLINNLRNSLNINLYYDPKILGYLKDFYNKNIGMKSIVAFAEHNIRKPIMEYKLKNEISSQEKIILFLAEEKLALYQNEQTILLEQFMLKPKNANLDEIKNKLNKIIGLGPVKEYVLKLEDNVAAQKMRIDAGFKTSTLSMNMIFTGNPGTGKTTVARIVAEYLKALGVISKGQCIEVTRSELVGEYQGQTAQKASNIINSAIGGVLFIDEAYSLYRGDGDSFGLEAIDILVKMMEDNKNNLVVILAGYSKEMNEFLKSNSGLKSRFPNFIDFPDYLPTEMYQIAQKIAKENDYNISPDCIEPLIDYFEAHNFKGNNSAGNGRLARNVVEKAILNQSNRILKENDGDYQTLKLVDFELVDSEKEKFNLEETLSEIIGLDEVKNHIRSLAAKINVGRQREKMGLANNNVQTLHMIFKGNPGTGKTMMARTVANMLYNLGVINTNNVVETDRAGLVAGYVGQTAEKTTEKVYEAINGVLFIDEAYTLSQGGENDFGREAIDTLVKLMDDNRDKLVVILAGYSDNMEDFLNTNPGLFSRFPNIVEFKDYNLEELLNIATLTYKKNGYELSESAYNKLSQILDEARVNRKFGNGRYVRNIFEKSLTKQALRVSILPELTKEDLITITDEDIEKL